MRTVHIETQSTDTFVTPNMTSVTQKLFCSRFMTDRPEKGSHVKGKNQLNNGSTPTL